MKKLMMAALLFLGWAAMVQAADEIQPRIVSVYLSTTTTPSSLVFSGSGLVYGVYLTTGPTSNYCVLRDTATANATSTGLLPRFVFATAAPQVIQFATPIRVTNGLDVRNGTTAAANTEECAVLYRKTKLW